jgi:O-antigen ligase
MRELITRANRLNLALVAWVAMFFSILIWTQPPEGSSAQQLGDSSNYYRIVLILFAGAASVWTLLRNSPRLLQAFPAPILLLLFYAVVAMFSSAYVPQYAFYSMWKGFEVAVDVLCMAAILSYPQPQQSARIAYRVLASLYGLLVIVYLAEAIVMPERALQPTRGYISIYLMGALPVAPQNAVAFLSAVAAFAAFCRLTRPMRFVVRCGYALMLCLALVTLVFAQSRTSVVALFAAIAGYLLFARRWLSFAGLLGLLAMGAFYSQLSDVSMKYMLRGQDAELVTSLSGRTEGWEAAWAAFLESPIVGHGFAAFARANILGINGLSSLHGAVFDVIVGTGLLGLLPWLGAMLWTTAVLLVLPLGGDPWFRTREGRSMQAEMVGVVALIAVRASTSSGLAMHEDNFMLMLTLVGYTFGMRHALRRRTEPAAGRATAGHAARAAVSG